MKSGDPVVSILICTRNRAGSLRDTLASLGGCEVPSDLPAELLVIDNGSTDSTAQVVGDCRLANIPVRYLAEPRKGKGYAYESGMAAAKGDIFLFTDDDVRPPRNWIEGMCQAIAQNRSDAVAGGVVFPAAQEAALSQEPYRSRRDWFASTEKINPNRPSRMVGANMAFSRRVLQRVGEFDKNLGPGALGFYDETLFSHQLLDCGFKLIAALDVAVEHHFDLSRLNRASMLDIAYRMGQSEAYVAWHWRREDFPLKAGTPMRMWAGLWRRRLTRPQDWIGAAAPAEWEIECAQAMGFRRQYRIESRTPRKYQRNLPLPQAAAVA